MGCTWIELHNEVRSIKVNEERHPKKYLQRSIDSLPTGSRFGSMSHTKFVLHNVVEEGKGYCLCYQIIWGLCYCDKPKFWLLHLGLSRVIGQHFVGSMG